LKNGLKTRAILLAIILMTAGPAFFFTEAVCAEKEMLGDVTDGSRATPYHLIPMLAEPLPGKEPDQIYKENDPNKPILPFSTKQTCGACHSYDTVGSGWHFNATDPNVPPGRIGQPWILADSGAATQIPLSYRNWPGTYRPQQMGITPMGFIQSFGRQMPGGGIGEMLDKTEKPEEVLKIDVTGQLEKNCLACHNISPGQDMGSAAGYAVQIVKGNYRWAATASSDFAYVAGTTKGLTDEYNFREPFISDTKVKPPTVEYYKDSFKHNDWVRFDVSIQIPKQRCYFCHSSIDVNNGKMEPWKYDEDIHLAAGLKCVDCHKNGLEHNITRGYSWEPNDNNNPLAAVSSCQGCHLGKNSDNLVAGRFAAPHPRHAGIPPVHFDKLSCTACHSGPWPKQETVRTKTSMAHAIGIAGANKSGDVLPHLVYPVFAKGQDGKIYPTKLIWPAFWASMKDGSVTPLDLDTAKKATSKVIPKTALSKVGDWPNIAEEDINKILALLSSNISGGAKPVYIAGGKLYSLNDAGKITSSENAVAAPYMWPIGHDVRPAVQSLGVRSCNDCHSMNSAFFFGNVAVDSPVKSAKAEMIKFQGFNEKYERWFAFSFVFRPWLKIVTLLSSLVIAGVLALYALKALCFVAKVVVGKD
jgi:hypothetical protein